MKINFKNNALNRDSDFYNSICWGIWRNEKELSCSWVFETWFSNSWRVEWVVGHLSSIIFNDL